MPLAAPECLLRSSPCARVLSHACASHLNASRSTSASTDCALSHHLFCRKKRTHVWQSNSASSSAMQGRDPRAMSVSNTVHHSLISGCPVPLDGRSTAVVYNVASRTLWQLASSHSSMNCDGDSRGGVLRAASPMTEGGPDRTGDVLPCSGVAPPDDAEA
eukprot:357832-Chlamydomonas_euryale.AAC.17